MVIASYIHIAADSASRADSYVVDTADGAAPVVDMVVDTAADIAAGAVVASAVVANRAVVERIACRNSSISAAPDSFVRRTGDTGISVALLIRFSSYVITLADYTPRQDKTEPYNKASIKTTRI